MTSLPSARELAFRSLLNAEKNGKYSNLELDSSIKKHNLSSAEKKFYTTLFYGVLERKITLDYFIGRFSSRPLTSLAKEVVQVLRLGLFQIYFLDRIPQNAAVNESVELIKKTKERKAASFVNAVLRNACRKKEEELVFEGSSKAERLSFAYSYPQWMVELWIKSYGEDAALAIMEAQNARAPLTIRVNTLKTDRETLARRLNAKGVDVDTDPRASNALIIRGSFSLPDNEEFQSGHFFVQDLSSQIACELLSPQAGETVLDVCCCPGGKSFHAAMLMNNKGVLRCCDLHASKLSLVQGGAAKLGIACIDVFANDSSKLKKEWLNSADRIICDVPCSGLGVIGKKPDIRQKEEAEIQRLPQIQKSILISSAQYLKKGGVLLYSTCTLNPAENEEITDSFLNEHKEFRRLTGFKGPLTLFPSATNDGFFIDLIERT